MDGHRVFTCWATMTEDRTAPWMIWACDEYAYEADPGARDVELIDAKTRLGKGYEFREITIRVDYGAVVERFIEGEVEGAVGDADDSDD